jgi:hypothetical protein
MRRTAILQLASTLVFVSGFLIVGSCREQPPYEEAALVRDGRTVIIECGTLPEVTTGSRCDVTPSPSASKYVLLRGTVLQPDRVLRGGEVLIDGVGRIACADCDCHSATAGGAEATQVTCPDGVISPALINTHDHITYNKLPPAAHATNRYDHRHEWRNGVSGDPTRPKLNYSASSKTETVQWNELRHLMAGTTAIVSAGDAPGVLRNLDSTTLSRQEGLNQPVVNSDTFPLGDTAGERLTSGCAYPSITPQSSVSDADSYEPHISEGINVEARNEFLCTSQPGQGQNLLLEKTGLIHGIPLGPADACLVSQRRAALIWSPRSNVALYGHTAQVPMFDRAGALLALGTDWTLTGSLNLLRELACADQLNQKYLDNYFSAEALWRMVTLNSAIVTATNDVIGQIVPGLVADISIFLGQRAYQNAPLPRWDHAAVVRGGVEDVLLVLRGGLPMYGDGNVMEGLGAGTAKLCEVLDVCGVDKRICVERETKKKLADLETAAVKPVYRLFSCGAPADEPTCTPLRLGQFDGNITPDDPDGDGLIGTADNCPKVFNPVRPVDGGKQADSDGDGVGDACDVCPLDKDTNVCPQLRAADCDGDAFEDGIDNCPSLSNPDQTDTDLDGIGDACDTCPDFANPGFAPCRYTIKDLRTPGSAKRQAPGTRVRVDNLLVLGLRAKSSFGFHGRDLDGSQDYAGVLVFLGGSAPPKASDGTPLRVGDIVSITGRYTVFSQQDEIDQTSEVTITGHLQNPPVPIDITTRDLVPGTGSPSERFENLLLRVKNIYQRRLFAATNEDDYWATDDMAETCSAATPPCVRIGDFLFDNGANNGSPAFTAGSTLSSVTGIVSGFNNTYSLEPRDAADIQP